MAAPEPMEGLDADEVRIVEVAETGGVVAADTMGQEESVDLPSVHSIPLNKFR